MRNLVIILSMITLLSSCAIFTPRDEFYLGMPEREFLRRNRDAVISSLEGDKKIYRVPREERFYVLITFKDGELTNVEEREITPLPPGWHHNNDPLDRGN